MGFRLTIGRKIGSGFALVLLATLVIFVLTYDTLKTGRTINDKINKVYNPSVAYLDQLKSSVLRSRTLINNWAFVPSREDTKEKMTLVKLINEDMPGIKYSIDSLSVNWEESEILQKEKIYGELDKLLAMYSEVQSQLRDMQSYDNPMVRFSMIEYAEDDGYIYQQANTVLNALDALILEQQSNTTRDSVTMISSFNTLERLLKNMGVLLLIFGVIIATFTVKSITSPVFKLRHMLIELGKGKIPSETMVHTKDEIGQMSVAMSNLVDGLKRTTEFANQVGKGNFETHYEPLSKDDVLGNALLVMRDGLKKNEEELKRNEQELERKVEERTRELEKEKNKVERQNKEHKELLENITASIHYAKRLQDNILPVESIVKQALPESFIFFKPKDIVSGDFYFVQEIGQKVVFAAVDCTGHGVPGAFMSLVGHNALNRAIAENQDLDPGKVLNSLRFHAANAFSRSTSDNTDTIKDGMDVALCVYDRSNATVAYSGAFNPLYIVRNGELSIYRADKISIGSPDKLVTGFSTQTIALEKGDMLYIFSDGYVDQFGGEKGKKFLYKPFREMLTAISTLPVEDQNTELASRMDLWRLGGAQVQEQIDDMLIIGVRHT